MLGNTVLSVQMILKENARARGGLGWSEWALERLIQAC